MTLDESVASAVSPVAERRRAVAWLAAALALPLLAACKSGSPPPTQRPERWPPGGR